MMRVGVDVVEIARLTRAVEHCPSLLGRLFTGEELQLAASYDTARRNEVLAGRFAAKEAALKALQLGIGDFSWLREIEVVRGPNGSPKLNFSGSIAGIVVEHGWSNWQVSISHEAGLATAFVLLS